MEPESSLPCSQEPSTGPYAESDKSNPYHPILSILILKNVVFWDVMEAIRSSETSVYTISTRRHNPENGIFHSHRRKNLKSYILILSTHLRLGLLSGLFPSGFIANILHAFLFSPFVLHILPISSSLT
jgi:hypothetical protein